MSKGLAIVESKMVPRFMIESGARKLPKSALPSVPVTGAAKPAPLARIACVADVGVDRADRWNIDAVSEVGIVGPLGISNAGDIDSHPHKVARSRRVASPCPVTLDDFPVRRICTVARKTQYCGTEP
jgi:hypothetical protein